VYRVTRLGSRRREGSKEFFGTSELDSKTFDLTCKDLGSAVVHDKS
jgi:hypothetical protein